MKRICVIGIGSPCGDDRIGWALADAIEESVRLGRLPGQAVRVERGDRLVADMVEHLRDADAAILIDAMQSGAPPGTVRVLRASELPPGCRGLSAHGFDIAQCLALSSALGSLPDELLLFGVEVESLDPLAGIGDKLSAAMPRLQDEIEARLRLFCNQS